LETSGKAENRVIHAATLDARVPKTGFSGSNADVGRMLNNGGATSFPWRNRPLIWSGGSRSPRRTLAAAPDSLRRFFRRGDPPGMVGIGHTVFAGEQSKSLESTFSASSQHHRPQPRFNPRKARGGPLASTGVIAGWGSPVFVAAS